MFKAGSISSTLGLDTSPFAQGMLQATSIAQLFPDTVTNFLANPLLGVVGIAKDVASSLKSAFLEVGSMADNVGEAAGKIGVSTEFLSGIGAAFEDAGSSTDGLAESIKFLNKNAAEAAEGNKEAIASFERLGMSVDLVKANLGNSEALFFAAADGIAGLGTASQSTLAAMRLLGKGGDDAIVAMSGGSAGLKAFAADVERLGGVVHRDLAGAGDSFGTLATLTGKAIEGIKIAAAKPVLLALQNHFGDAKEGIFAASQAIRDAVGLAVQSAVAFVESNSGSIKEFFTSVGSGLEGTAGAVAYVADLLGLFGAAWQTLRGIAATAIAGVMAPLTLLIKGLEWLNEQAGGTSGDFGDRFEKMQEAIAAEGKDAFKSAGESWDNFVQGVNSEKVTKAFAEMRAASAEAAAQMKADRAFADVTAGGLLGGFGRAGEGAGGGEVGDDAPGLSESAATAMQRMQRDVENFGKSDTEKQVLEFKGMEGVGAEQVAQYEKLAKQLEDLKDKQKLVADVDQWRDSLKGPIDKYDEAIAQLEKWRKEHEITQEEFEKGMAQAQTQLDDATADDQPIDREPRLAQFIRADSADAMRLQFANSQQQKDEVPRKQLAVAERQARTLDEISGKFEFSVVEEA